MSGRSPIESYLAQLSALLGWRRFFERRTLLELRDHLECSAREGRRGGMSETDAEVAAVEALGTLDQSLRVIVESNRLLALSQIPKDRVLVLACLLTIPGVALLVSSFLTFNFPCSTSVEAGSGHASYVSERCGVSSLQFLRPWLADFGQYGMASWYQLTQFIVTTLGPLAGAVVLLAGQTRLRFERDGGASARIVVVKPGTHRMAALVTALTVFAAVFAYKLAG